MPFKKSYTVFVWATVLYRGYVGIYWRRLHQKKKVPFSLSWGERVFSQCPISGWSWSGDLDALSMSSQDIQTNTPRLIPHHCFLHGILADRHQSWNNQHWSLLWYSMVICDIRWWDKPLPLWSRCPGIPSVSWMQQSTSLLTTLQKTQANPLQLWRLTMDSSANYTWHECCWFQLWRLCTNMWRWRRWLVWGSGHSSNSQNIPLRTPKTWEQYNIFNKYRLDMFWRDCHFGLKW